MKYLKYFWDEARGDACDSWGTTTYYFEIGDDNYPIREIEIYQNGNSLKYDFHSIIEDEYGCLSDQPIIKSEMGTEFEEIEQSQFEELWNKSGFINGISQW